jgi:hypothetical protein
MLFLFHIGRRKCFLQNNEVCRLPLYVANVATVSRAVTLSIHASASKIQHCKIIYFIHTISRRTGFFQVRSEVLTEASMKLTVFWDVALCTLVEVFRRFRGAYCLHQQGLDDGCSKHLWNVGNLLPDYTANIPEYSYLQDLFSPTSLISIRLRY